MSNEPVAWMDREGDVYKELPCANWCPPHTPLYTHPVNDTALLRQALEALEQFAGTKLVRTSNVITALRERLGEKT